MKNLAFGLGKPNKSSSGGSKKSKTAANGTSSSSVGLTEEWQQRDQEFVEDDFEAQLQQALMASKVEYQKKKEMYGAYQLEKESVADSKDVVSSKNNKKAKKGTTTMSLDEFNQVPLVCCF